MRGGCGADVVLETLNAARAFLTIDSGFPLSELEQSLRVNRPFTMDYHAARVPILYNVDYWQSAKDKTARRVHRFFPVRPFAVPPVPGAFETRSGNRGRDAQADSGAAAQALRAHTGLLRRDV